MKSNTEIAMEVLTILQRLLPHETNVGEVKLRSPVRDPRLEVEVEQHDGSVVLIDIRVLVGTP